MRRSDAAEWILSLVTAPDRATSTVGDLMEGAATHGSGWFWWSVLRTAFSLLWHDLMIDPAKMTRLALFGLLLWIGFFLAFGVCIVISAPFVVVLTGVQDLTTIPGWLKWLIKIPIILLSGVWLPFQIGRTLARHSPSQELVSCFAFVLLQDVIFFTIGWAISGDDYLRMGIVSLPFPIQVLLRFAASLFFAIIMSIPLFAGAIVVRQRSFRVQKQ